MGTGSDVDWDALRAAAAAVAQNAYAPYSGLRVGAAAQLEDGRIVTGCNVENASYGLTLCAEVSLVGNLVSGGGGTMVAVATVAADGRALSPCGRCRQLLLELGGADLLVNRKDTIAELLPGAFDDSELPGDHGDQGDKGDKG